jgi:hypothetical protein
VTWQKLHRRRAVIGAGRSVHGRYGRQDPQPRFVLARNRAAARCLRY